MGVIIVWDLFFKSENSIYKKHIKDNKITYHNRDNTVYIRRD